MRKMIGGCISGLSAVVIASIGWGYSTSQEVAIHKNQIASNKESIKDINAKITMYEERYLECINDLNLLMYKADKRITIMETILENHETSEGETL